MLKTAKFASCSSDSWKHKHLHNWRHVLMVFWLFIFCKLFLKCCSFESKIQEKWQNCHITPTKRHNKMTFLILKIFLFTILFPTEKWLSNVYRDDRYISTTLFLHFQPTARKTNKSISGSFSCVDISRARCNRRKKVFIDATWKRELVVASCCRWCRRFQLGRLLTRPSCPALGLSGIPFHLQKDKSTKQIRETVHDLNKSFAFAELSWESNNRDRIMSMGFSVKIPFGLNACQKRDWNFMARTSPKSVSRLMNGNERGLQKSRSRLDSRFTLSYANPDEITIRGIYDVVHRRVRSDKGQICANTSYPGQRRLIGLPINLDKSDNCHKCIPLWENIVATIATSHAVRTADRNAASASCQDTISYQFLK